MVVQKSLACDEMSDDDKVRQANLTHNSTLIRRKMRRMHETLSQAPIPQKILENAANEVNQNH
jgi:hypothetical protein